MESWCMGGVGGILISGFVKFLLGEVVGMLLLDGFDVS